MVDYLYKIISDEAAIVEGDTVKTLNNFISVAEKHRQAMMADKLPKTAAKIQKYIDDAKKMLTRIERTSRT